ncbi:non-ribosomal peptide synthetase [Polyangium mundeleinium]|uniref:Amino acid adenylation domain-containing protein n=1 Tax=Polyangium mundeleinium TaxID=2995306 RepID=A0ABT5ESY4_9BACT|nr:non-ribosomal peptide synthetase [Polyangium mundeleinium]MDC0744932.1 amino acid adenylation domain-containing protein [Polyangium mundeleinium]
MDQIIHDRSCVLMGVDTLLLEFGKRLLARGWTIRSVITPEPRLLRQAREHGLTVHENPEAMAGAAPFGWLFSIVDPAVLSPETLALPKQGAINFHDSPLPRYAGAHATAWALMDRVEEHGVTWHSMSADIGASEILVQRRFGIRQQETSHTLNLRCFEEALAGFDLLLDAIERNALDPRPQKGEGSHYGEYRRPAAACILDWKRPAVELEAMVRALDFGPYHPNALGSPMLVLGGQVVVVARAHAVSGAAEGSPGQITGIREDSITLATGEGQLVIEGLATRNGEALSISDAIDKLGLVLGMCCDNLAPETARRLDELNEVMARSEPFWANRLVALVRPELPHLRIATPSGVTNRSEVGIPEAFCQSFADALGNALFAAIAAFFSVLCDCDHYHLALQDTDLRQQTCGLEAWVSSHVPVEIVLGEGSFLDLVATLNEERHRLRTRGTWLHDAMGRHPMLRGRPELVGRALPIGVEQWNGPDDGPLAAGSALTVAMDLGNRTCVLGYDTTRFDPEHITDLQQRLTRFLERIARAPDAPLVSFDLLSDAERQLLLYTWNDTAASHRADTSIYHLFSEQAARTPIAIAVADKDTEISYAELEHRSNQLAEHLRAKGVEREDRVGVCMERGVDVVVTLLGVLKTGGAYVPIDPRSPKQRTHFFLEDARVKVLLTQAHLVPQLPPHEAELVCIDTEWPTIAQLSTEAPAADPRPESLACVIYTSGSTGRPNGVMVEHRNLLNLFFAMDRSIEHDPPGNSLAVANLSFDASILEIFWPLTHGLRVTLVDDAMSLLQPAQVERCLAPHHAVTHMLGIPSLLRILCADANARRILGSLEQLWVGGEAFSRALAQELSALCTGRVTNLYGPTETTVGVTMHDVIGVPESIPIGRPISNTRCYVLDRHRRPVPVGVPGELYIGGASVSRGYHDRRDLTAERFLDDPFRAGERIYRTGDKVRHRPDGALDFLGRIDHQVKLRGNRIELEEVERALERHAIVQEAAASIREIAGDPHLVAWVTAAPGHNPDPVELRRVLREHLPPIMVPSQIVVLEAMPLTPNGKIDRKNLPTPAHVGGPGQAYVAPSDELQSKLAVLWADILGIDRVGVEDSFFDLGGDSLKAIRLARHIGEAFGIDLSTSTLLMAPTIEKLAPRIAASPKRRDQRKPPPLLPRPAARHEPFALMPIQKAYWVGRQPIFPLGGVGCQAYVELDVKPLDPERLDRAVNALIGRHEMLRVVFQEDGLQRIMAEVPAYTCPRLDLRKLSREQAEEQSLRLRERLCGRPFELDRWPHFAIHLTHLPDARDRIHFSVDSIIADGHRIQILFRDLVRIYAGRDLPPLEVSFRDYSQWYQTLPAEGDRGYWRARLQDLPPAPALPYTRPLAGVISQRYRAGMRVVDEVRWSSLKQRCAHHGVTPSALALAVFVEALGAWSQSPRFTINVPFDAPLPIHPQINDTIGNYAAVSLIPIDLSVDLSLQERARNLQLQIAEDQAHGRVSAVEVLRTFGQQADVPEMFPIVFTTMLGHSAGITAEDLAGFPPILGAPAWATQTPQVCLDHLLLEVDGSLWLHWDVVEDLFPAGMIDDLFDAYVDVLRRLASEPALWTGPAPSFLPQRTLDARAAINATQAPLPEHLLHTPILEQARQRPEAVAVIDGSRRITYRELVSRARRLARRLCEQGDVEADELVAVVMHKGWEQIVAVLAILEAGGAYYPIAADLPALRRHDLLKRGRVRRVLTQPRYSCEEWPDTLDVIGVSDNEPWDSYRDEPLAVRRHLRDLAYVLLTSGSTGQPKGVAIEHRSVANTIADINDRFAVGPGDRVLGVSALGFDLSAWDIFGTLSAGATLVLPQKSRDPEHWASRMRAEGVTIWNSTPAMLQLLVEHADGRPGIVPQTLRLAMLSGDWIPVTLPDGIRALVPGCHVQSLGGPTETSIWSIGYTIQEVPPVWTSIPYGRPLRNHRYHVLDSRLRERPEGIIGELYAGGAGLARGYYGDPERTAERFLTHPLTGERLYKTGDLGRWMLDGNIEFCGREDHQVKIGGYRIELGEIAWQLEQHPLVQQACIDTVGPRRSASQLVAFVVLCDAPPMPHAELTSKLRAWLAQRLPDYMVPTYVLTLEHLPLSANGKVDRAALPDPRASIQAQEQAVASTQPLPDSFMNRLKVLTADVLGVSTLDLDPKRSFFELGASSLKLVRLQRRLSKELGVEVDIAHLFRYPTLKALGTRLALSSHDTTDTGSHATAPKSTWLQRLSPPRPERPRLYALPPAGAGTSAFRPWASKLHDVEVWALALPGREIHAAQSPITRFGEVITHLEEEILQEPRRRFVLYGHSLGALIAFELARRLEHTHGMVPDMLIVGACRAPQLDNPLHFHASSSNEEILHFAARIDPSSSWTADADVVAGVIPALRADLLLFSDYRYREAQPLSCPLTAWGGEEDIWVERPHLMPWAHLSRGAFQHHTWPGGHLFLEHPPLVSRIQQIMLGQESSPRER